MARMIMFGLLGCMAATSAMGTSSSKNWFIRAVRKHKGRVAATIEAAPMKQRFMRTAMAESVERSPGAALDKGTVSVSIGTKGVDQKSLSSLGHRTASSALPVLWVAVANQHAWPACNDAEFKIDLGVMQSKDDCLKAAKNYTESNIAFWQEDLDKDCHVCDLAGRGNTPTLKYVEAPHVHSFAKFVGHSLLYSNDGNELMKTPEEWKAECGDLPANVKFITTTYSGKTDFFKPVENETYCSMLQSNNKHMWSPTGYSGSWVKPEYDINSTLCGGSKENWLASAEGTKDDRQYLGSWCAKAEGAKKGGMGSQSGAASWGQEFTMSFVLQYDACSVKDGSTVSSAYPCECGHNFCGDGQVCNSASNKQCQGKLAQAAVADEAKSAEDAAAHAAPAETAPAVAPAAETAPAAENKDAGSSPSGSSPTGGGDDKVETTSTITPPGGDHVSTTTIASADGAAAATAEAESGAATPNHAQHFAKSPLAAYLLSMMLLMFGAAA